MTAGQYGLTPRILGRVVSFLITLAVGIGISQLIPQRVSDLQNSKAEAPPATKYSHRRCRR